MIVRLVYLLIFTISASSLAGVAAFADDSKVVQDQSLCALSREALSGASVVRELALKADVPCVVEDKFAVANFIQETIKEDLPPRKLAQEEIVYKAIGLIPDAFDYQHALVEFLVSQIGGYYNPKRKLFVMAGWLPAAVQGSVAVHELTHALQDQHYNLSAIMNAESATTDSGLAASALVEGDASAVMFDYERKRSGQKALQTLSSVDSMLLLQVLGLGLGGDVPESLKALLIFPYTSGLRFVHALLRRGGYSELHRVYAHRPATTREILHPEEYIAGSFSPQIPAESDLEGAPVGVAPEYSDVLGEFGISSIFRGAVATKDRGALAAAGWVGDKLALFPAQNGVRTISWLTRWEDEREAHEFSSLYREYLRGVYGREVGLGEVALTASRKIKLTERGREVSLNVVERE
jgi:hypothetical protein